MVKIHYIRHFDVVGKFAIRLVRNYENRVREKRAFFAQNIGYFCNGFGRVHNAARIVGGIDDNCFRSFGYRVFERGEIRGEVLFVKWNDDRRSAGRFYENFVFGKVRREYNKFVAAFVERAKGYAE